MCYISEARSIEYFPAGQLLKNLTIETDLERLRSFGMNWDNASLLRSLIEGNCESFHQSLNITTPAMQQVLRQILDCPYHGTIKRIYLESKVLELLALQFHQLALQSCTTIPNW
ncbi:hypothetical protein [Gloeocapsopsis dulcis]|uniref:hypothetical protein n=1 Tax=Gloeocapsopsis dulcis TaxID=2859516 RepID=UPI00101AE813|nr:hypothetical protein [Gloeocapsopsis dulcis]WNN90264.1 hypothetical protein P0S91_03965 [Gloeocapsopsis dulcis]